MDACIVNVMNHSLLNRDRVSLFSSYPPEFYQPNFLQYKTDELAIYTQFYPWGGKIMYMYIYTYMYIHVYGSLFFSLSHRYVCIMLCHRK